MTTEKDLKPVDREFPKVKYQGTEKGAKCVTVRSEEEEAALGEGWLDGHEYWSAQRERDEAMPESVTPESVAAPEVPASTSAETAVETATEEVPAATPIDEPRKKKGKTLLSLLLLALALALAAPHASAQQGLLGRSQVLNSAPTVNNQATVSFPAAPEKWVFDQVCFSASAAAAVTAAHVAFNIRDGATGAGTVLASFTMSLPTASADGTTIEVPPVCMPLGLTGSANTAATAEYSAGVTGLLETATLMVHKAQ